MASMCFLILYCILLVISNCAICAASSSDKTLDNPSLHGENNGHKWQIKSIQLTPDLVYDIKIINNDKIAEDITSPPPMVLIHGWMDSRLSWMSMLPYLLSLFNNDQIIILPTLRGHGDSQIFPIQNSTFSLSEYVDDILLLLKQLGFSTNGNQKFHFIGHSMGSIISMKAVINYPQLLASTIFMNGLPKIQSKKRFNFDANKNEPTLLQKLELTRKTHDSQVEKGWISSAFADILIRENLKVQSIAMRESYNTLYEMDLTESLTNVFSNYDIQSMVVFGDEDFFPSSQQIEYAQSIGTNSDNIISLNDCGHDTLYRYPELISNKIYNFLMKINREMKTKNLKLAFNPDECGWDDVNVELDKRDIYGRARFIYDNKTKLIETLSLIKQYKIYDLGIKEYSSSISMGWGRYFQTKLEYSEPIADNNVIYSQQNVDCNALGNVGTQLDGLGQIFYSDNNDDLKWYNNFTNLARDYGVERLGVESMKSIISRAILIDLAGLYNVETLPGKHIITVKDIENALLNQGLTLDDILWGDILLFYSGHSKLAEENNPDFWNYEPGPCLEVVDFAASKGIVMLGSDSGAMELLPSCIKGLFIPVHQKWITCYGGLITEFMRFDDWLNDARNGIAPWIGAYFQLPIRIKGAVGSPGAPIVIV